MGMFSEIAAGATAEKLGEILLKADAEGGEVKRFAKEHLYQWYLYECGDAYDPALPDKKVVEKYKE